MFIPQSIHTQHYSQEHLLTDIKTIVYYDPQYASFCPTDFEEKFY